MGMLLDPLADKLMIAAAYITLVRLIPDVVSVWVAVIIVGREFLISGLRSIAASEGFTIEASELGKLKMVVQIVSVVAAICAVPAPGSSCPSPSTPRRSTSQSSPAPRAGRSST